MVPTGHPAGEHCAFVPALDEAYKNSIMIGKFPMCFLNVTIAAEKVDVNVHPAKTEIRFSDEAKIFEVIYYAAVYGLYADILRMRLMQPVPMRM